MPEQLKMVVCQRCGRGFIVTRTYRNLLARRGAKVVVPVLCPTCFYKEGPQPKQRGQVKWFDPRRNYGFITTGESEEVFFHRQQILEDSGDEAHKGQAARFHVRHSPKGMEALNVELIEK